MYVSYPCSSSTLSMPSGIVVHLLRLEDFVTNNDSNNNNNNNTLLRHLRFSLIMYYTLGGVGR